MAIEAPAAPDPAPPVAAQVPPGVTRAEREAQLTDGKGAEAPVAPAPKSPRFSRLGSRRHNLVYVQFQVSPIMSDLLSKRAEEDDVVLGEVVLAAVRTFEGRPVQPVRRRHKSSTASRRQVLVRPGEADEIKTSADRLGYTPSALIRAALEQYLR